MSSPHVTAYRVHHPQQQHAHLTAMEGVSSPSRRCPAPSTSFGGGVGTSSLDCNSTNPSGGGSPFATRSINMPTATALASPGFDFTHAYQRQDSTKQPFRQWGGSPVAHKLQTDLTHSPIPLTTHTTAASTGFQSNLGASLAAHRISGFQINTTSSIAPPAALTTPPSASSASPLPLVLLQRNESVPSSVGSTVIVSPGSQSPLTSATVSPSPSPMASSNLLSVLASSPPLDVAAPDPISLWFGCEDDAHARTVLTTYATALCSQRAANSRAPLEFIGRVKREQLDVSRLRRLVDQHLMLSRKGMPKRHASAADASSISPRKASRFNAFSSPSSSPCDSRFAGPVPTSPLHDLPPAGSFATLDLVSIYARDTLPLGLVFPLIRHEWVATVWNTEDGVQETSVRIHTEYEAAADEEEEELDEEEIEAKATLGLYVRACVKPAKLGFRKTSVTSPASADVMTHSSSSSSICSTASASSVWHPAMSPAAGEPKPAAKPEPRVTTSYLYNLPIFSEDCDGSFNTFGCKLVRPLGCTLGPAKQQAQQQKGTSLKKRPSQSSHHASTPSEPLPSGLGYSGSQNDCVYDCLVGLGRKVKCNSSAGLGDACGEAQAIDQELKLSAEAAEAAAAAAFAALTAQPTVETSVDAADSSSDSSSSEDSDSEDFDDLDDLGDEDQEEIVSTRTRSAPTAIKSNRRGVQPHSESDDDSDCEYTDSTASSFAGSFISPAGSCAAGSLQNELQAQLQAMGFGAKRK